MNLKKNSYRNIVKTALKEDLPGEDITISGLDFKYTKVNASILARDSCTLCGTEIAEYIFKYFGSINIINILKKDASSAKPGEKIMEISGNPESLLKAERTAINFLSHLSGIATQTQKYAHAINKITSQTKILDTRKTLPGLRKLQKYAVRCGGGENHRMNLSDRVLIKENHLTCSEDSLPIMLEKVFTRTPKNIKIEIEVENIFQLKKVLSNPGGTPDIIMLDNFNVTDLTEAVKMIRNQSSGIKIEISGGITLDNIESFAAAGPDYISVGRLTNSSAAIDFSMLLEEDDK